MLDRVNSPMTNAQISEFVLEKGYTTYFTLQEVLNTLISDGFITEESYHSSTHYTITDSGRETINFFLYLPQRHLSLHKYPPSDPKRPDALTG